MVTMSYGGGIQTVAIITLILEGRLPKPDLIVMADTGREVQTTWDYLAQVVQPSIRAIGLQVEICGHDYARYDIVKNGAVLLPAFTRQKGTIGKMPTFCSGEWKQRPIRRWLRARGVMDTAVWLGISMDEAERMRASGLKWYQHVYPLIEMIPMRRAQCVQQIQQFGWEVPHKSRCWMCPNQSPDAWRNMKRLKNGDFEKAVQLEKEVQKEDRDLYFHPLAVPLDQAVEQSEQQSDMFDGCDSGYCFT